MIEVGSSWIEFLKKVSEMLDPWAPRIKPLTSSKEQPRTAAPPTPTRTSPGAILRQRSALPPGICKREEIRYQSVKKLNNRCIYHRAHDHVIAHFIHVEKNAYIGALLRNLPNKNVSATPWKFGAFLVDSKLVPLLLKYTLLVLQITWTKHK